MPFCRWLKQPWPKITTCGQAEKDQNTHFLLRSICWSRAASWLLTSLPHLEAQSCLPAHWAESPRRHLCQPPALDQKWSCGMSLQPKKTGCVKAHSQITAGRESKSPKPSWPPAHEQSRFCASLNGKVLKKLCDQSEELSRAPRQGGLPLQFLPLYTYQSKDPQAAQISSLLLPPLGTSPARSPRPAPLTARHLQLFKQPT